MSHLTDQSIALNISVLRHRNPGMILDFTQCPLAYADDVRRPIDGELLVSRPQGMGPDALYSRQGHTTVSCAEPLGWPQSGRAPSHRRPARKLADKLVAPYNARPKHANHRTRLESR